MNKDFERWLKQDSLFDYYQNNPSQQENIFNDYQWESASKDFNSWVQWVTKNPELAEKYYPKVYNKLTTRIKKSEPFPTALMIQKIPDEFPNWKIEVSKFFGIKKQKLIQQYIELIDIVLEYTFDSEIIQQAADSVKAELVEQKMYWQSELEKSGRNEEKDTLIELSSINNNFDFVKIVDVYKHFKAGLFDKKYIAEKDLLSFIKAAFDKRQPPKKLFSLKNYRSKKKIISVFNDYYKNVAASPHGRQKEYAALLGDYFDGYITGNVSTNFSR